MNDLAVKAHNLGKLYKIGRQRASYHTLRDSLTEIAAYPFRKILSHPAGAPAAAAQGTLWALRDINLEIRQGEIIGVIGRNGAGKSTLLKILSNVTEPTLGHAEIRGRVGSLLEIGAGFHPELSGRENIFLNGAILGMKRSEINSKLDEIIAFSEIARFIDTPVKHYSSGMYMRLAFAVAAHLDSEILVVDEVLAVGDINFQRKCIQKMGEISRNGQTVIVVSHNLRVIETLTEHCIYLKDGLLNMAGETGQVIKKYQEDALSTRMSTELPSEFDIVVREPVIDIMDIKITDPSTNQEIKTITPDSPVNISCVLASRATMENIVICVRFYKDRMVLAGNNSEHLVGRISVNAGSRYHLNISFQNMMFVPGTYTCVIFVLPDYFSGISCSLSEFKVVDIVMTGSRTYGGGFVTMRQQWEVKSIS
jgi:ABC-type polysaccharide/polyol phosphate transport system ATPase subunit